MTAMMMIRVMTVMTTVSRMIRMRAVMRIIIIAPSALPMLPKKG